VLIGLGCFVISHVDLAHDLPKHRIIACLRARGRWIVRDWLRGVLPRRIITIGQQLAIRAEQVLDRDVLVDVRPVDAYAPPDQLPLLALLRRGAFEPREPREGAATVRPSSSRTARSVSLVRTSTARALSFGPSLTLRAEVLMPCLLHLVAVLPHDR
jgi:hypothetical protein